ncbi:hypothetical protein EDB87DRAFT_1582707 [Lactarius vividus]|nr:hypothetical protein EDB87DRAFT_1582707 [Lactarius vividus]
MTTPPIPPHVEVFIAPRAIGNLWNWTFYNFAKDRALLKLLVYSLFLVETLQTTLSGADLYYWFVSGFGNMDPLSSPYMAAFAVPLLGSIILLTVQLFFVYRIWVLSERSSWFICLIICLCTAAAAVAAFTVGIETYVLKTLACNTTKILTFMWLSGNALSDILIAVSLLSYLGRRRREGGRFSDHTLLRIVRLTVETNALTATVGIVSLLMAFLFPDKTWFTCPLALLGKL